MLGREARYYALHELEWRVQQFLMVMQVTSGATVCNEVLARYPKGWRTLSLKEDVRVESLVVWREHIGTRRGPWRFLEILEFGSPFNLGLAETRSRFLTTITNHQSSIGRR